MGLQEDTIDLLQIDGACSVSNGLEHGTDAEVLSASQCAFRRACDERGGLWCEGRVREGDSVSYTHLTLPTSDLV